MTALVCCFWYCGDQRIIVSSALQSWRVRIFVAPTDAAASPERAISESAPMTSFIKRETGLVFRSFTSMRVMPIVRTASGSPLSSHTRYCAKRAPGTAGQGAAYHSFLSMSAMSSSASAARQALQVTASAELRSSTCIVSSVPGAATQCAPMRSKSCPAARTGEVYTRPPGPVAPVSLPAMSAPATGSSVPSRWAGAGWVSSLATTLPETRGEAIAGAEPCGKKARVKSAMSPASRRRRRTVPLSFHATAPRALGSFCDKTLATYTRERERWAPVTRTFG